MIFHTKREAAQINRRIDRRLEAIERELDGLLAEVTDHGLGLGWYMDEIRRVADRLRETVARRTAS